MVMVMFTVPLQGVDRLGVLTVSPWPRARAAVIGMAMNNRAATLMAFILRSSQNECQILYGILSRSVTNAFVLSNASRQSLHCLRRPHRRETHGWPAHCGAAVSSEVTFMRLSLAFSSKTPL